MKKILGFTLVFFLIFGVKVNGFVSFANDETKVEVINKENLRNKVLDEYMQLEEFQMHLKENPENALNMIDRIVDTKFKIASGGDMIIPQSGQGFIALINYPKFKQNNSYYCGPASALTAIYGMGKQSLVSGSTYSAKQETLAKNMGTKQGDGTIVYNMMVELNKYSTEKYNYFYAPTKDQMSLIIGGSLLSDNAPILHARTRHFEYYNGYDTGHYVTVVFQNIRFEDNEIGGLAVMDNNRTDTYYGTRDISLDEAYNSIRGRYLIGVSL